MSDDISIIDVGAGNAAFCTEDNCVTIIDSGHGPTLILALEQRGIRKINSVVLSHADADHCGGLITLLLEKKLVIDNVFVNSDAKKDSMVWDDLLRALNDARPRGSTNLFVDLTSNNNAKITGCHQQLGFEILPPVPALAAKGPGALDFHGRRLTSNSMSAVVRILKQGQPFLLLPGDMDWVGLENLLEVCPNPNARVMVFPHHGGTPQGGRLREFAERLCSAVKPELVIFSIGRGVHSTPRPEIIEGVRAAVPAAYILCTQLSNHCAADLPDGVHAHLSARPARGKKTKSGNQCCGGTAVLDLTQGSLLREPLAANHTNFVVNHAPTALCRR